MTETVAYQGRVGAFGEEACRLFLPDHRRLARPSFEAVVEAVVTGEADCGMLPEENLIAGEVPNVRRLIEEARLTVVERRELPVRIHLLARPGATLDDIEQVASHPMAIAQCGRFLEKHGFEAVASTNTATAAEALASSRTPSLGVLASGLAAEIYNLAILVKDVQDRSDNHTLFSIVRRRERPAS